jgi:hypothetical protein
VPIGAVAEVVARLDELGGDDRAPAAGERVEQGGRGSIERELDGERIGRRDVHDHRELVRLGRALGLQAGDGGGDVGGVENAAVVEEDALAQREREQQAVFRDGPGVRQTGHDHAAAVGLDQRVVDRLRRLERRGGGGHVRIERLGLRRRGDRHGLGRGAAEQQSQPQHDRAELSVDACEPHAMPPPALASGETRSMRAAKRPAVVISTTPHSTGPSANRFVPRMGRRERIAATKIPGAYPCMPPLGPVMPTSLT